MHVETRAGSTSTWLDLGIVQFACGCTQPSCHYHLYFTECSFFLSLFPPLSVYGYSWRRILIAGSYSCHGAMRGCASRMTPHWQKLKLSHSASETALST